MQLKPETRFPFLIFLAALAVFRDDLDTLAEGTASASASNGIDVSSELWDWLACENTADKSVEQDPPLDCSAASKRSYSSLKKRFAQCAAHAANERQRTGCTTLRLDALAFVHAW